MKKLQALLLLCAFTALAYAWCQPSQLIYVGSADDDLIAWKVGP